MTTATSKHPAPSRALSTRTRGRLHHRDICEQIDICTTNMHEEFSGKWARALAGGQASEGCLHHGYSVYAVIWIERKGTFIYHAVKRKKGGRGVE